MKIIIFLACLSLVAAGCNAQNISVDSNSGKEATTVQIQQGNDLTILRPSHGDKIPLNSSYTIQYQVSSSLRQKLNPDKDITEIYLIEIDGSIIGYIGKADPKQTSSDWQPNQTSFNAGLGLQNFFPNPGTYQLLMVSGHKPSPPPEGMDGGPGILLDMSGKFNGNTILDSTGAKEDVYTFGVSDSFSLVGK